MSVQQEEKINASTGTTALAWPPAGNFRGLPRVFPVIPGFDLNAGPEGLDDPAMVRRSRRLGTLRRNEEESSLPDILREEALDPDLKRLLYRVVGTRALSGEDLPSMIRGEVELARIQSKMTVHCESVSLRGRPSGGRIRYRLVDEYESEDMGLLKLPQASSRDWPTLGQLIYMIDNGRNDSAFGLAFGPLTWDVLECEGGKSKLLKYQNSIEVTSLFYPDLQRWYAQAFRLWLSDREPGEDFTCCQLDSIAIMLEGIKKSGGPA